jgi:hypothetical protein
MNAGRAGFNRQRVFQSDPLMPDGDTWEHALRRHQGIKLNG